MEIADKIVIMADSDKIEKNAFEKLCEPERSFTYVTDSKISELIALEYKEYGIDLIKEKR